MRWPCNDRCPTAHSRSWRAAAEPVTRRGVGHESESMPTLVLEIGRREWGREPTLPRASGARQVPFHDSSRRGANSNACQYCGGCQSLKRDPRRREGACPGADLACRPPSSSCCSRSGASRQSWSTGRGSRRSGMWVSFGPLSPRRRLSSWLSLPSRPCFSGRTQAWRSGLRQGHGRGFRRRSIRAS